ncbi:MAG: hypothetical protein AAF386_14370, partial [Pseudomonadota bacterium]
AGPGVGWGWASATGAETISVDQNIRQDFREFYEHLNAVEVEFEWFIEYVWFPSFGNLHKAQDGYSYVSKTGKPLEDWPKGMTVIADASADPFYTDLSKMGPIYHARHGMGKWDGKPIADNVSGLLLMLCNWYDAQKDLGDALYPDPTDPVINDRVYTVFRDKCAADGINPQHIANVMTSC